MNKLYFLISILLITTVLGCRKKNNYSVGNAQLDEKTTIVSNSPIKNEIVAVDSTSITFNNDSLVAKGIKVGSILVSEMTALAEYGYLRKVISISNVGGKIVCQTETASLVEAIENGSIRFKKTFTNADILTIDSSGVDISAQQKKSRGASFKFDFDQIVYDEDNDISTKNDQIKLKGDIEIKPEFEFEMDIENHELKNLLVKMNLKNTNNLKTEAKLSLPNLKEEKLLYTFQLAPFHIIGPLGIPIPIAKQWIAIVIGVDGKIHTKLTIGAENVNTCSVGLKYENGVLNPISSTSNNLTFKNGDFEGKANLEGWLQVRYEIRPYGLKQSRIYLGAKGSIEADATISNNDLIAKLEWGVNVSAKAQLQIFSKTLLDYEQSFFDQKFPIGNSIVIPFNLNSGLVAYYPFNGNANDESGNGNNGAVYGGASLSADRHGNSNKAYSFDGVDDYIEVLDNSAISILNTNNNLSVSLWVQTNISPGLPFFKGNNTIPLNDRDYYSILIDANNYVACFFGSGGVQTWANVSSPVWHHIVYCYGSKGHQIFVDNILCYESFFGDGFSPNLNPQFFSNNLFIGKKPWSSSFHNGSIDDIRIYNRALNSSEVEVLFNQ